LASRWRWCSSTWAVGRWPCSSPPSPPAQRWNSIAWPNQKGVRPFRFAGAFLAAVPVVAAAAAEAPDFAAAWAWRVFIATTLVLACLAIFRRGVAGGPLAAVATTVFGALFTGGTLAYAVLLREMPVPAFNTGVAQWVGPRCSRSR
jgi:hypothetical protein